MMSSADFGIRIWLLAGAVVAGVTATELFGLNVEGGALRSAYAERFDAWYVADDVAEANSADVIVEYDADFDNLEQQLMTMVDVVEQRDTLPIHRWEITQNSAPKLKRMRSQRLLLDNREGVIPVEIFALDTTRSFDRFIDKLIWGDEVRVAFLGDSFVEGDILTSDFRELMQQTFGGRGVGFVQCDIPFGTVRRTVKRTASGWNAYSVLKPKANPSSVNDAFFVSGYTARGGAGAKVTWQTTTAFEHLDSCSRARIWLNTPDSAHVRVKLNGSEEQVREFDLVNIALPQQILIDGSVDKLEMSVVEGVVDCYGATIEGVGGVIVDNLSMRANSGHAIFGTSAIVNRQIDEYAGYDLVVLQYGLNVMENNKHHYSSYRDKLREMIAYAKSCFPDAAVLVIGVSDRWIKDAETEVYGRMNSIESMTSYQRAAAETTGAAFWSAAAAMEHYGGMSTFVRNSWAAGDYTHINFAGGKRVGEQLYRSIVEYAYQRAVSGQSKMPSKREEYYKPIKVELKPFENSIQLEPVKTTPAEPASELEPAGAQDRLITESVDIADAVEPMEEPMEEVVEPVVEDITEEASTTITPVEGAEDVTLEWDNYQMDIDDEQSAAVEESSAEEVEEQSVEVTTTLEVDNSATEDEFFETTM